MAARVPYMCGEFDVKPLGEYCLVARCDGATFVNDKFCLG